MPTYEYICDGCGHEFEKFQSIKADPITLCPVCGKEQVRRKISGGAAIIFKGGGFYETDYRSDSYNDSKKKDVEGGSEKTDSKGDAKAEAAKGEPAKGEPAKGELGKGEAAKPESTVKAEPAPAPASPKPEKPVPRGDTGEGHSQARRE